MEFKKKLATIVISAAVGIGSIGCSKSDSVNLEQNIQTQNIEYVSQKDASQDGINYLSGIVVGVDEEKFSVTGGGSFAKTNGDFYYEILRIKDETGNITTILFPYSTPYENGDYITLFYEETGSISYYELIKDYGYNTLKILEPLQDGKIEGIDGIVSENKD